MIKNFLSAQWVPQNMRLIASGNVNRLPKNVKTKKTISLLVKDLNIKIYVRFKIFIACASSWCYQLWPEIDDSISWIVMVSQIIIEQYQFVAHITQMILAGISQWRKCCYDWPNIPCHANINKFFIVRSHIDQIAAMHYVDGAHID